MKRFAALAVAVGLAGGCTDDGPVTGPDVVIAPDSSVFNELAPGASDRGSWHDVVLTHVDLEACNYEHLVVMKPTSRAWYLSHPFIGDRCEVWLGGDFSLGDATFPDFGQPATYCVFDRHGSIELHTALPVATIMDDDAKVFCRPIPVVFFPPGDCPSCGDGGPL